MPKDVAEECGSGARKDGKVVIGVFRLIGQGESTLLFCVQQHHSRPLALDSSMAVQSE